MFRNFTCRDFKSWLLALVAVGVTSHAMAQTPVRIMPLGDSITSSPGCWRAYLWNRLQTAGYTNIDFVGSSSAISGCGTPFTFDENHEGHSGFSITGIADQNQLPPWLTAARPDIIVMHLGTNDMWGGHIPLATKITALTKLIGQMRAFNPGIKLVAAKIIPMDAAGCTTCMTDVVAFNNAVVSLAASLTTTQSPIYVADLWTGFDVVNDTFDRVHPITSGFVKMSNAFFPVVAQALNATAPGFPLTVIASGGGGGGFVESNPAGINCGTVCAANFPSGTMVTLNARVAPDSVFAGWSGACTGTGACVVSMTQARSVSASFAAIPTTQLSVQKAGTGTGTVTSIPAGINCGTICVLLIRPASQTAHQLVATPAAGSVFAGWSGACTGTGACVVVMTISRNVTATFNPVNSFPLAVTRAGSGTGVVSSNPAGISCGTTCTTNYAAGTSVTLTAALASNSTFAGWSGACTGTALTCTVSMTQARNVTATFNAMPTFTLTVTRVAQTGGGTVTSNPAGINCGTTCSANFGGNAAVTLTATPSAGAGFLGWSGACTGMAPTCTVVMNQARNVTATFMGSVPPVSIILTVAGTGGGIVTSNPAGLNCQASCIAGFQGGTVTLTATPAAGSTFAGWTGACTGTGTCTVIMSQPRAVTATFTGGGTGGTCANPITFSGNTGNFNTTGAVCYRTNANINGWGCFNFDGRTLTVSGVARTCGQMPVTRAADGYYYFAVTAGQFPWAGLFAW